MGNSVLEQSGAPRAPVMKTVSLPRGRHRLHAMPTSTGYEIRTSPSYDWNGRRRGQTPFTVLQHTIAGAGNLQYERRRYRAEARRHDAHHRAAQSSLLAGGGRALGVLLDLDERPGGGAHPSHHPGDHRAGVPAAARDDRAPRRLLPAPDRRRGRDAGRRLGDRL